ncbi:MULTISPECIES: HAD-IA family hydrolase [Clostridium]|uniref:5'-nucleotidase n=3 Tax=Clostridium TaxID=1485 RepID=A0A162JF81_9CLOT|nr:MULTISPECIES: HAD-IA family hydrolase [Clostridium]AGY76702.1 HAD-IA family hydrolase [Clostridium autoethanogenum DSM 10061]ALU36857.1 HAD-superfamily hydrolase subfamily IA variant 1 [Clostridium autoethanogenum DSM 10061]OAA94305.1 5'-nucleotidase [Clostridium coskatii]OBR95639.1 5'-nucleotidase [Clostridium coskatii]OVY50453.1 5'-nucleotidase [Clostridium autoethanogenum]
MKYKYILFDLDGTITESKEGITKSVQYALKKFGIIVESLDLLEKFIGPPLKYSFSEYFGFDENKSLEAVQYYREYFEKKGIMENKVYDHIEDLLKQLKELKLKLIIATSKPTKFSNIILNNFNLTSYFDAIVGSNMNGTRCTKGEVIKHVLEKYRINSDEAVMIGDRKYDMIGARQNNMDSIGVTYGYGSLEELKNENPTYIADSVMDILNKVTQQ